MKGPLDGIKVLDFTRYQNGPHATVMLSDMGAEVLKVETPAGGDLGRALGLGPDGFCAYFEALNRGKKSITLDLRSERACEIIHRLIETYDVLTENFRPGFLDSVGLGYDELSKVNPKLIYATNSGFGPRGPWRERGSFDVVSQGMSGAMVSMGGGPGMEPRNGPWGLADQVGSMVFAYGITNAIVARERFGVGQKVDVSQLGAMLTLQALGLQSYLHYERQGVLPYARAGNPPFSWYEGSDGKWVTVGVLDPKNWPKLAQALERPDLATDPRSATAHARAENRQWVFDELQKAFAKFPRDEAMRRLVAADVPTGPVYDYAEVVADEQMWVNGYLAEVEHPHFAGHRAVGIPVEMSATPGSIQGPAPELGQHTEEVLLEVGYSWEEIEALRDAGVTYRAE
jgi:crotonobetainyl-CoA:carnitine CoA-transferase CaiB-like acyl-CoA transferase